MRDDILEYLERLDAWTAEVMAGDRRADPFVQGAAQASAHIAAQVRELLDPGEGSGVRATAYPAPLPPDTVAVQPALTEAQ